MNAWELLNEVGAGTDDMYIYDETGILHTYFDYGEFDPTADLETEEGWDNVWNALVAASGG